MYLNGVALISSVLMFQSVRPELGQRPALRPDPPLVRRRRPGTTAGSTPFDDLKRLTDEVGEVRARRLRGAAAAREPGRRRRSQLRGGAPRHLHRAGMSFLERCDLRVAPAASSRAAPLPAANRWPSRQPVHGASTPTRPAKEPDTTPATASSRRRSPRPSNAYLRAELGFERTDDLYEVLNGERVRPWNYGEEGSNRFRTVASMLRQAMSRNPGLEVLLASGYFDLATPFAAASGRSTTWPWTRA